MVETIEKLWTFLWLLSPLFLVIVIWLSRASIGSSEKEKSNFRFSLILAFLVGLIGMLEVKPGGWNIQLLFRPFFITKWMFISYSIVWPILVFINLSKQTAAVGIARLIICFGIVGLLISAVGRPYVEYKDQEDRQFWDSFFENNEINRPISELKKRLSREGHKIIGRHVTTGYTTTSESLVIILEVWSGYFEAVARNRSIDREFIEKILMIKDKNGYPMYASEIAQNDSTPVDVLVSLSLLPKPPIYNLVMNANTPREVFEIIACDDNDYEKVLLGMKSLEKKKGVSASDNDYLRNIRMYLNTWDKSEKERIQNNAKGTLKLLQGRDRASEIISQAIQAVKRNKVSSVVEILSEIKERDLSMRDRDKVYYGMLLCIAGDYERAKSAYWDAEHAISYYGNYNKEHLPQYITTLLLAGRGADKLLTKMSTWYPNDAKIQEFVRNYPMLKQELEKFAVDDHHKPAKAPESLDTFLSFGIFD